MSESKVLLALCDTALAKVLHLLKVNLVVAIGKYAEKRACVAINDAHLKEVKVQCCDELWFSFDLFPINFWLLIFCLYLKVVSIPHPSPRNAHCSGNWKEVVANILRDLGILDLFTGT